MTDQPFTDLPLAVPAIPVSRSRALFTDIVLGVLSTFSVSMYAVLFSWRRYVGFSKPSTAKKGINEHLQKSHCTHGS